MRRLHQLRSEESGFTLVELLAAMAIGLIILTAAFTLLDRATALSQEIANRQDALQRGRVAMEQIVRELRSQVCLGDETEPITEAGDDRVTFFLDLSDGSKVLEQRTLVYEADEKAIYEEFWDASGEYPELVFTQPAVPERRLILSGVEPIVDGGVTRPLFRYYAFNEGGVPGDLALLPTPLSDDDKIRTVMVKVGFTVLPERRVPEDREATTLESDIYVRLADPSRPLEGPRCI